MKRPSPQNRKCIDGKVTGINKCVGYCGCKVHPGYLTISQYKNHRCTEKECIYFTPKEKSLHSKTTKSDKEVQVMNLMRAATANFEGLKIIRATHSAKNGWQFYYAAIADYNIEALRIDIEAEIGEPVIFKSILCSFDIAAQLVFS